MAKKKILEGLSANIATLSSTLRLTGERLRACLHDVNSVANELDQVNKILTLLIERPSALKNPRESDYPPALDENSRMKLH